MESIAGTTFSSLRHGKKKKQLIGHNENDGSPSHRPPHSPTHTGQNVQLGKPPRSPTPTGGLYCLSVCLLTDCLSVCLSVCLFVCLSVYVHMYFSISVYIHTFMLCLSDSVCMNVPTYMHICISTLETHIYVCTVYVRMYMYVCIYLVVPIQL